VGVGLGVGGTIRLWRTALFYGESRSREYQVDIAWVACLASISTNQQKHIHCREASTLFCSLFPTPLVIRNTVMACLGRAGWEMPPHFGPHSAITVSDQIASCTQHRFDSPSSYPSHGGIPHDLQMKYKASVWFSILQWDHRISSAYPMKSPVCGVKDGHNALIYRLVERSDYSFSPSD
jgi:hypothetical protein